MAHSDNLTSLLINRQVPEFVREQYPLFISFLEAYYEYLENKQGSQLNDSTTQSKLLKYASDVDHSISEFETSFFNTYADLLPRDVSVNKEFLIKNVLPVYLAKGNEKAFKLLFRMLYNDEVEIKLPKTNVLRPSDGQWTIDNELKIETDIRSVYTGNGSETTFYLAEEVDSSGVTVYIDDVEQTLNTDYYIRKESLKIVFLSAPSNGASIKVEYSNFTPTLLANRKVTGLTSGATAIIERAVKRIITDTFNLGFPYELFINPKTLNGSFETGEIVQTDIINSLGQLVTLQADSFAIVTQINIIDGGASYNVGDPVLVVGGGATTPATAEVLTVVSGLVNGANIVYGGAGFSDSALIESIDTAPEVLQMAADIVDTTGVANSTINTYTVYNDVISPYANVNISATDYGFASDITENVSTVIADALTPLTLQDLGPITNVIVLFSNTDISSSPTLDSEGATYPAGNVYYSIKTFESVGRIQINDGGDGYVPGDEVVFTNPSGTYGQGAAAAVKEVDVDGAITQVEIQPWRVQGTVNIANTNEIVGTDTYFGTEIRPGDKVIVNNEIRFINTVANTTHATVNVNFATTATGKKMGRFDVFPIGGQRYVQSNLPTLTVTSDAGANANLQVTALTSDGENILATISGVNAGQITAIKVLSGGSRYQYIPQIDLTGYGDGLAIANVPGIDPSYATFPGRWTSSDSILSSSERKIQGEDYYIDYSYVTSSLTEFTKYKKVLKDLLHPAGFVNYADLNRTSIGTVDVIDVAGSNSTTISGVVNVTSSSIYMTGLNTFFELANTNGILSVGSNVSVNGEIRTIASFVSNSNISVTSAFTNTANLQTLIILD